MTFPGGLCLSRMLHSLARLWLPDKPAWSVWSVSRSSTLLQPLIFPGELCLSCMLRTLHNSGCPTCLFGVECAVWMRHAVCHCDSCAGCCETPVSSGSHPAFCGLNLSVFAPVAPLGVGEQQKDIQFSFNICCKCQNHTNANSKNSKMLSGS